MKILVLNGSPKRDKSDTMHITRAFLEGMKETAEVDVHVIDVIDKKIEFCRGCFTCMRNGGNCVCKDDMKSILDEILESDLLLLSFPLYAYGMPAVLKSVIERTLPLTCMTMQKKGERYEHVDRADLSKLKYLMICGCGFPNSRKNFEPAVMAFDLMFPEGKTAITVPESPMFNAPEATEVTLPRLNLIRKAGAQYAGSGRIDDELMKQISSPMIPEEVYAKIVNG